MQDSHYYRMAKNVIRRLSIIPEFSINNSTKKTVDQLKVRPDDQDEAMISFNVSSLYTNVPVNEAIEETANCLY